jgi:tRNA threonylcarbamoyladenosine modification (KEOPS) complex  Pcc1 subunit
MLMSKGDLEGARAAFFQMPSAAQNESITRYLGFKLAIKSDDYDFAMECLRTILKHADRDATYLYACALEAQRSQRRNIAVAALQALMDKQPPGVHLPSLLRCTARLLIAEIDQGTRHINETAQEYVSICEYAASNVSTLKQGTNEQWQSEIQWWSKNSYNMALKLCGQIHPEQLIRLLQSCSNFIDAYSRCNETTRKEDLSNRRGLCHFLSAAALITLGRSYEEGSEHSLQCYLQARREIETFKSIYQSLENEHRNIEAERRHFELQKFDLECILNLKQWDAAEAALESCLAFSQVDSWDALADIVLIIHQHAIPTGLTAEANNRMMELLDRIINDTWQKHKDILKASRWLRLSFSLDLNDGDGNFAHKLLLQAAAMAKKQMSKGGDAFPERELQWVAATAFNHAVDLLSAERNEDCLRWIDGALELARYAADNGALHANLTDRKGMIEARMTEGVV